MRYRELGKTGLKLSELGFGAMRLPMKAADGAEAVDRDLAIPMIHRAFEGGVNYIDSAVFYCNGDSQRAVGEALKSWRGGRIHVGTKNNYYGPDEAAWWKNLEDSLKFLQVDCIDLYHTHGVNWKGWLEHIEPHISHWMRKARDQGLIRHIVTSFHDDNEALRKIIDTGFFESVLLQYNLLDRKLEDGIAHAGEKGVGVIVMGPVAGGRLGAQNPVFASMLPQLQRVPELALRFVLANPGVTVALSGMSSLEQVKENVVIASDPATLSETDRAAIDEHLERLKKMKDLYCSGCGYCKPCPQNVDIPAIFDLYNNGRVYGFWDASKGWYKGHCDKKTDASQCTECGACTEKCPQKIDIPNELKKAAAALT